VTDTRSAYERRWQALALLAATQFVVVLDAAIVNVALPSIGTALDFSQQNLQWVVNAYVLTFGGFLLLGGRAADLLGRKRLFIAGLALFSLASLACGFAESESVLIAARAVQGLGAAIISPAALAILTDTFAEGADRNKALGVWGAVAGSGGAVGVLLGGILTDSVGWEWIFFINAPVGIAVIAFGSFLLRESRVGSRSSGFDALGALTVTGGLVLLVYGLSQSTQEGWGSPLILGLLAGSAALLALFLRIESRAAAPLMPLGIFRNRTLSGANAVGLLLGASIFSMFFFLALYMQQVLGYSALRSGFAYLLIAGVIIVSAAVSQALVTRIGVKTVLVTGMVLLTAGILWFTQISVEGSYMVDLAPGFVIAGIGLGFSFVPVSIAALTGVRQHEAGIASGLINTSQQIGGALGVAVLATVANSRTDALLSDGASPASALTDGFQYAFAVGAGLALIGLVAALVMISRRTPTAPETVAAGEPRVAIPAA
jgi:EmrB/QacA subfamily drug resistance transporter